MSGITTHVLDTSRGRPAAGLAVTLCHRAPDGSWTHLADGLTDVDGRAKNLIDDPSRMDSGVYRITFDTAHYFASLDIEGFYPEASVVFTVRDPSQHFHVPLLLNPYGYSTYRGS
ncbi:MAG: hydroxyisourate hydrolase [Polyangiales bacterium]